MARHLPTTAAGRGRVDRTPAIAVLLFIAVFFAFTATLTSDTTGSTPPKPKISPETEACIGCHQTYTPGIVHDWLASRHARITPGEGLKKSALERRVSAQKVPDNLSGQAVGCYECHSLNPKAHKDNFEHMGFRINVVVSPSDCATCHPVEVSQYGEGKMAHAYKNLMANPVYHSLAATITGKKSLEKGVIKTASPSDMTLHETCLGCHGTKVEAKGLKKVNTKMGEIEVPRLTNWPSQGVGRENPDGSIGSCTACHTRHAMSIETARKPYTCSQCHLEPDVPAWNVFKESKHGNIFDSKHHEWDFKAVPWKVGKDFSAPTCAACHNSLVVSPEGEVIAERSHNFGARLWVRIFGLPYAHPQPKSGNTTTIRNKDGLPLPTTFTGEPAWEFLIDAGEQEKRQGVMRSVCNACHSSSWISGHFAKMDNTIKETNEMTLTSTKLLLDAWSRGVADKTNPFDEQVEQLWLKQWLFYSNSIRYASAMTGAPDYASFHNGWWYLTTTLQQMKDLTDLKAAAPKKKTKK